jgi:hypothetical protein
MAVNEIGSELHQTRKMYCAKVKYIVYIRIHIPGGHANKKKLLINYNCQESEN